MLSSEVGADSAQLGFVGPGAHFVFHFHIGPQEEVAAIVLGDRQFAQQGNELPGGDYVPKFCAVLSPPGLAEFNWHD